MKPVFLASLLLCFVASGLRAHVDPLENVLSDLKVRIETHQWLQILDQADPAHRRTQTLEMRMNHAQYVAELLGLNYVDNSIRSQGGGTKGLRSLWQSVTSSLPAPAAAGGTITEADLNQIRKVEWTGESDSSVPGWRSVKGIATLKNGRTVRIEANFVKRGNAWKLTGAVG